MRVCIEEFQLFISTPKHVVLSIPNIQPYLLHCLYFGPHTRQLFDSVLYRMSTRPPKFHPSTEADLKGI